MSVRQEVNLYLPEFRKDRSPLSAQNLLLATGVFILLLSLVQTGLWWSQSGLRKELDQVQQQKQTIEQRVTELRRRVPESQKDKLSRQILQLQQQVEHSRRISGIISGQNLGNSKGFSGYMQAMARQSLESIALTEFRFLQGGEYVELDGQARQADAVPLYIQRLRKEERFARVKFGVMSIEQNKDWKNRHSFTVGQPPAEKVSLIERAKKGMLYE